MRYPCHVGHTQVDPVQLEAAGVWIWWVRGPTGMVRIFGWDLKRNIKQSESDANVLPYYDYKLSLLKYDMLLYL